MKKIFLLILMAVMVNGWWSMANAQSTLNIHTTTNGTVCFTFAEKPQVTFPSTEVMQIASTTVTVEFPYSEVEKITFNDEDPTAVQTLTVRDNTNEVRIYDLNGRLVRRNRSRDGAVSVDLSTLPVGVYIVKDGKRTYKVKKQ
ncbi:MAG: T9SS type A sorting domain-containing protein [Bacteroidaceae bacterium]|nr:T9SS type A sorting domain-containing protein [Bacteroidaceae bacterium]